MMTTGQNGKAMASLAVLMCWEIWNERNDRVFKSKHAPSHIIFKNIRKEARLWVLAGAKRLGSLMPGE
jgi:hypothetical protein